MRVCPEWDSKGPSEAEIRELEVPRRVDEEILGLKIAMKDAVSVAIMETCQELQGEFLEEKEWMER